MIGLGLLTQVAVVSSEAPWHAARAEATVIARRREDGGIADRRRATVRSCAQSLRESAVTPTRSRSILYTAPGAAASRRAAGRPQASILYAGFRRSRDPLCGAGINWGGDRPRAGVARRICG